MGKRTVIIPYIPPRRPAEEWEHVHVTRGGRRFVEVEELLGHEDAKQRIKEVAALTTTHLSKTAE